MIPPRSSNRYNEGWEEIENLTKDKPPLPRWIGGGPEHLQRFDRPWTKADQNLCDDIIAIAKREVERSRIEHENWVAEMKAKNARVPRDQRP